MELLSYELHCCINISVIKIQKLLYDFLEIRLYVLDRDVELYDSSQK